LQPTATQEEIKHAFRRLAKQFHPDVNADPDAESRFKLIYIAYDILSDSYKRSIYDELQLIRLAEETLRMRRWKKNAGRKAEVYADMEFESFENKAISAMKFHAGQSIGFLFAFVMMCLGFGGIISGSGFVLNIQGEDSIVAGCFMWVFGAALLFSGARALLDVLKEWREN
jgi:DnaJ-class molecular chaperone